MISMYLGTRKFDRDQLVFVVESILCSAFDRIDSCLPNTVPVDYYNQNKDTLEAYMQGCMECVGMNVAVLWAQTCGIAMGDGMGIGEFEGWGEFQTMVANYKDLCLKKPWPSRVHPECYSLAQKIVDMNFFKCGYIKKSAYFKHETSQSTQF